MVVDASSFREGEARALDFVITCSLPSYYGACGEAVIKFDGAIGYDGGVFNLEGRAHASYAALCSRCLGSVDVDFEIDLTERFVFDAGLNRDAEVVVNGKIDAGEAVYAAVVSEMPRKVLCSSECAGIDYGADVEI